MMINDPNKGRKNQECSSYYDVMPDGTEYFYCGSTRIKVSEHFAATGKSFGRVMENVIQHAARSSPA